MAGEVITVDQLRQLLGVQAELRQQAENRWQASQRALVTLLEAFAPEEVDRRLKNGQALDSLGVEDLALLLRQYLEVHSKLIQNRPGESDQDLKGSCDQLQAENRRLSEQVKAVNTERDALQTQLSALQQASAAHASQSVPPNGHPPAESSPVQSAPQPEWMADWRASETFERDAAILRMLGETGLARRPQIEQKVAELLGIRKAGGSVRALFNRLEDLSLIEIFRPWDTNGAKTGGRSPDLIRLSERGRLAYWLLCGSDPAQNEYDALLPQHVSPEHTLLNLQAADFLRQSGCKVDPFPSDIHLPDGGLFRPDLVIVDAYGQTLYIEVEAEATKNREQRQAKWRNALQAGGGRLHVFCDNRSCMHSVRSEINFVLGRQPAQCFLTNLVELQAGKRASDGGIWLDVRQGQEKIGV